MGGCFPHQRCELASLSGSGPGLAGPVPINSWPKGGKRLQFSTGALGWNFRGNPGFSTADLGVCNLSVALPDTHYSRRPLYTMGESQARPAYFRPRTGGGPGYLEAGVTAPHGVPYPQLLFWLYVLCWLYFTARLA